jgi:hypothetical protein
MVKYEWGNRTIFGTFLELRHGEVIRRIHLSTSFGEVGAGRTSVGAERGKNWIFEPSRGFYTPLTKARKRLQFPYRS